MVTRIVLVDDHEIVRIGLRAIIEAEADLSVVGEAGTAEKALTEIQRTEPDIALVDLQLAEGNGIEVCREVSHRHPHVRCLVLSAFSDHQDMIRAVAAGAAGYVLKQRASVELVSALRAVEAGGTVFDPALAQSVIRRPVESHDTALDHLSGQERRILALIAEGATNRQIGQDLFLSEKTVKNYVSRLLTKLGMARRTEAAAYGARLLDSGRLQESN